jgi:hypothetical protein
MGFPWPVEKEGHPMDFGIENMVVKSAKRD